MAKAKSESWLAADAVADMPEDQKDAAAGLNRPAPLRVFRPSASPKLGRAIATSLGPAQEGECAETIDLPLAPRANSAPVALERFPPKRKPVRRRKRDKTNEAGAFSAEVEAGSAQKTRQNQRIESVVRFNLIGTRARADAR